MDGLVPILVISLIAVTAVILFAFIPIKLKWFFHPSDVTQAKQKPKRKTQERYKTVMTFGDENWDDYDDPEL